LERTRTDPNVLVKKAIAQLEPIVLQKEGKIIFDPDETGTTILADNDNLYLAIFNVINNAVKYSDMPKIIITTGFQHLKYFISIKDNGVGISQAEQKKIFKKFYRAQNGNVHNTKGLGLGLYFVKKI
jgi:two-component system phosphate regulon sensor histidine kinase PhoR